jgi:hypothetical protein
MGIHSDIFKSIYNAFWSISPYLIYNFSRTNRSLRQRSKNKKDNLSVNKNNIKNKELRYCSHISFQNYESIFER